MSEEVDTYKIFRELEAREKRAKPYKFYDKDELIDEILKNEDEIERLNNIINELEDRIHKATLMLIKKQNNFSAIVSVVDVILVLKGSDK